MRECKRRVKENLGPIHTCYMFSFGLVIAPNCARNYNLLPDCPVSVIIYKDKRISSFGSLTQQRPSYISCYAPHFESSVPDCYILVSIHRQEGRVFVAMHSNNQLTCVGEILGSNFEIAPLYHNDTGIKSS